MARRGATLGCVAAVWQGALRAWTLQGAAGPVCLTQAVIRLVPVTPGHTPRHSLYSLLHCLFSATTQNALYDNLVCTLAGIFYYHQ